jgi:excisionase family DNA binding protein
MATADPAPVAPLLYTLRETAQALRLGQRTTWGLIKAGRIPAVKIGRALRIDPRDLMAFIDAQKAQAAQAQGANP